MCPPLPVSCRVVTVVCPPASAPASRHHPHPPRDPTPQGASWTARGRDPDRRINQIPGTSLQGPIYCTCAVSFLTESYLRTQTAHARLRDLQTLVLALFNSQLSRPPSLSLSMSTAVAAPPASTFPADHRHTSPRSFAAIAPSHSHESAASAANTSEPAAKRARSNGSPGSVEKTASIERPRSNAKTSPDSYVNPGTPLK